MNLFLSALPLASDPSLGDLGTALDAFVLWLSHIGIKVGVIGLILGVIMLITHHSRGKKMVQYSVIVLLVAATLPTLGAWLSGQGSVELTRIVSSIRVGP
jgi:hypothetical protein